MGVNQPARIVVSPKASVSKKKPYCDVDKHRHRAGRSSDSRSCGPEALRFKQLQRKLEKTQVELQRMQRIADRLSRKRPTAGKPAGVSASSLSISQEQGGAGRMNCSEAQFRALVESSADHIFMLDAKGVYLFSNDPVRRFGLQAGAQLVGKRLQDVYPPEISTLFRRKLKQVITENKGVIFDYEKETERGLDYLQYTLYPIHREPSTWAVGGLCRDLSEQKRIEKQLFQAQKMDALGTLTAGAAHELNNPINLMLFNLPLFGRIWQDLMPILKPIDSLKNNKIGGLSLEFIQQNMPRLISDMELAANRVAQIVNGLKQFSRKSNPAEKHAVQVNHAVDNATRLASATLSQSKTELMLNLSSDLPLVHANLQNVEQIILNLIINAFQAITHEKGWVRISTGWCAAEQGVIIQVSDNGRGINPKVAERIFDPFVTDRQKEGGTGLGLSVTYSLVKAHQGDITFETRPGHGTIFTVTLPTREKHKSRRVMVVDDDTAFRAFLIQMLSRKSNCVVEGFANGAEALIRLGSDPPDLLVLDMFMPEIDGLRVCRAIQNELGLEMMKVIIVTGFPDHPNIRAAKKLGFEQIFNKPLNKDKFLKVIEKSLDGKLA